MKIYPRRIIILPDTTTYELNIKNSSNHELIILFRIKRAEKKVLTFGPKKGFVLPGETRLIPVSLLSREFVRTKLLVKLVAVPRAQINSLDFDKSWLAGMNYKGEIKKIIDIINSSANLDIIIESNRTVSNDFEQFSDLLSESSNTYQIANTSSHYPPRAKSADRSDSAVSAYEFSSEFQSFGYDTPSVLSPGAEKSVTSSNYVSSVPENAIEFMKALSHQVSSSPQSLKENLSQELQAEDVEKLASFFSTLMKTMKKPSSASSSLKSLHQLQSSHNQSSFAVHQQTISFRDRRENETADSRNSEPTMLTDIVKALNGTASVDPDEKVSQLSNEEELSETSIGPLQTEPNKVNTTVQSLYTLPIQPQPLQPDITRQSIHSQYSHHSQVSHKSSHHTVANTVLSNSLVSSIEHHQNHSEHPSYLNNTTMTGLGPTTNLHSSYSQAKDSAPKRNSFSSDKILLLDEKTLEAFSTLLPNGATDSANEPVTINPKSIRMSGNSNNSLNVSQSSAGGLYQSFSLEIFHEQVNALLLKQIIEARIIHAIERRQKISIINLSNAREIYTCKDSLSLAFFSSPEEVEEEKKGSRGNERGEESDSKKQLFVLRKAYLEDYLYDLQIEHTSLISLDASLNRFHMLTSLNLSNNQIKYIDGMILLPQLSYLNLSHNFLKSLDYLQSLYTLKTLIVSNNRIETFKQSISLIITLSNSLTTLDLSENPVSNDVRYAEEVILAFPKLRVFDHIVLEKLYKSYTNNDAINKYKLLQQQQQQYPNSKKTGKQPNLLPEFPCVLFEEERKLLSSSIASSTSNKEVVVVTNEKRFEFIQKVKRALGLKAFQVRKERVQQHDNSTNVNYSRTTTPSTPHSAFSASKGSASKLHRSHMNETPRSRPAEQGEYQYYVDFDPVLMQSQESRLQYEIYQEEQQTNVREDGRFRAPSHSSTQDEAEEAFFTRSKSTTSHDYHHSHNKVKTPQNPQNSYQYQQKPENQSNTSSNEEKYSHPTESAPPPSSPPSSPTYAQGTLRPPQPTPYSPRQAMNMKHRASSLSPTHYNESSLPHESYLDPIFQKPSSPPHFATHTTSSKKVGRKNEDILIPHWGRRSNSFDNNGEDEDLRRTKWTPTTSPRGRSRSRSKSPGKHRNANDDLVSVSPSLIQETASVRKRRRSFGVIDRENDQFDRSGNMTYHSDTEVSTRGKVSAKLSRSHFKEMQEHERYSIWHPRYRVPKPIFGYSKPFIHRPTPHQKRKAPLFDQSVKRIREGFEKLPTRGTFTRASKGLPADFYPMDHDDVEAIRRQGYFHETIGNITKFSYQDFRTEPWEKAEAAMSVNQGQGGIGSNMSVVSSVLQEAKLNPSSGSTLLSPQGVNSGRRGVQGAHISRMYKSSDGRIENTPEDDFSGYRKWHPDLIPTNNTNSMNNSILLNNTTNSNNQNLFDTMTLNNSTIDTRHTTQSNLIQQQQQHYRAPSPVITSHLNTSSNNPSGTASTSNSRRPSITSAITLDTGLEGNGPDLISPASHLMTQSPKNATTTTATNASLSSTGKKHRNSSVLSELFGMISDSPSSLSSGKGGSRLKNNTKEPGQFSSFFSDDHDLIAQSSQIILESSVDHQQQNNKKAVVGFGLVNGSDSISYISSNASQGSSSPRGNLHKGVSNVTPSKPSNASNAPPAQTSPPGILKIPRASSSATSSITSASGVGGGNEKATSSMLMQHYYIDNYSGDYVPSEYLLQRSIKPEKSNSSHIRQHPQSPSHRGGDGSTAEEDERRRRGIAEHHDTGSSNEGASMGSIGIADEGNSGGDDDEDGGGDEMQASYLRWLQEQHKPSQDSLDRSHTTSASLMPEYQMEGKSY